MSKFLLRVSSYSPRSRRTRSDTLTMSWFGVEALVSWLTSFVRC